jgi:hypothetical protein
VTPSKDRLWVYIDADFLLAGIAMENPEVWSNCPPDEYITTHFPFASRRSLGAVYTLILPGSPASEKGYLSAPSQAGLNGDFWALYRSSENGCFLTRHR